MATRLAYANEQPNRGDLDMLAGATLLEFGANHCGYCLAAEPLVAQALAQHHGVRHVKVEDGKGRPLGRSYGVKLWPTLIFLRDGKELERLVRPTVADDISEALARLIAS